MACQELSNRYSLCRVPVGGLRGFVTVPDCKHVYRLKGFGKAELVCDDFGVEPAYPHAPKPETCCLHHHVVGGDCRIDVNSALTISWALPGFRVIRAHDDGERRTVNICRTAELSHSGLIIDNDKARWL